MAGEEGEGLLLIIFSFIVFNFLFNRRENPEEVEDFVLYWQ